MDKTPRPWGRIVAMLVASYVTLLGLWAQLDPEVILLRASLAACVVACVVRVLIDIVPVQERD